MSLIDEYERWAVLSDEGHDLTIDVLRNASRRIAGSEIARAYELSQCYGERAMTSQEAFDKVRAHLLAQGTRALGTNGRCVYRAPDGKRCAVGCLIPDDEYDPAFEGEGVWDVHTPALDGLDRGLLGELQDVHDALPPEQWEDELRKIALKYGLRAC